MGITRWRWKQGKEVGRAGVAGRGEGKGRKLYLNNNKKKSMYKNTGKTNAGKDMQKADLAT